MNDALTRSMEFRSESPKSVEKLLQKIIKSETKKKRSIEEINRGVLPIIDLVKDTITHHTFIQHLCFSMNDEPYRVLMDEDPDSMHILTLLYLDEKTSIPKEMFEGPKARAEGKIAVLNEYRTRIRIWKTYKKGNRVFFDVTVVGYKGAIPEPRGT